MLINSKLNALLLFSKSVEAVGEEYGDPEEMIPNHETEEQAAVQVAITTKASSKKEKRKKSIKK